MDCQIYIKKGLGRFEILRRDHIFGVNNINMGCPCSAMIGADIIAFESSHASVLCNYREEHQYHGQ